MLDSAFDFECGQMDQCGLDCFTETSWESPQIVDGGKFYTLDSLGPMGEVVLSSADITSPATLMDAFFISSQHTPHLFEYHFSELDMEPSTLFGDFNNESWLLPIDADTPATSSSTPSQHGDYQAGDTAGQATAQSLVTQGQSGFPPGRGDGDDPNRRHFSTLPGRPLDTEEIGNILNTIFEYPPPLFISEDGAAYIIEHIATHPNAPHKYINDARFHPNSEPENRSEVLTLKHRSGDQYYLRRYANEGSFRHITKPERLLELGRAVANRGHVSNGRSVRSESVPSSASLGAPVRSQSVLSRGSFGREAQNIYFNSVQGQGQGVHTANEHVSTQETEQAQAQQQTQLQQQLQQQQQTQTSGSGIDWWALLAVFGVLASIGGGLSLSPTNPITSTGQLNRRNRRNGIAGNCRGNANFNRDINEFNLDQKGRLPIPFYATHTIPEPFGVPDACQVINSTSHWPAANIDFGSNAFKNGEKSGYTSQGNLYQDANTTSKLPKSIRENMRRSVQSSPTPTDPAHIGLMMLLTGIMSIVGSFVGRNQQKKKKRNLPLASKPPDR